MIYYREMILKNGRTAVLRNGTAADGEAALETFRLTHAETDYLLSMPEEDVMTVADESGFLAEMTASETAIEILAVADGRVVGSAGIEAVGNKHKVAHRAEFGVAVERAYWGLGLGRALTEACIVCARRAGYTQLELNVVADNERAVGLYRSCGFAEYGRNPRGFGTSGGGYSELVYMRLEL